MGDTSKGTRLATQNRLIFQVCFIMLKMKRYMCVEICVKISDKSDKK